MSSRLPNILSFARLAGAPVLVLFAALGWRAGFLSLCGAALLTDALDGYLARRLHAESELGRKLDSWADYATLLACAAGLWLLWPVLVRREWPWFASGLGSSFAIVIIGVGRWKKLPSYHTWFAKLLAVAFPFALGILLAGVSRVPFHLLVALQVVSAFEELAIAWVLPGYSGQVSSVWHACAMRSVFHSSRQGPLGRPAAPGKASLRHESALDARVNGRFPTVIRA